MQQSRELKKSLLAVSDIAYLPVDGLASLVIELTGTFTGTVIFEYTINGTDWYTMTVKIITVGTAVTGATAVGKWEANVAAYQAVKVRCTAFTSGSINVCMRAIAAGGGVVSISGGGGGDASAANQTTGNASLDSIDDKIPTLGQAVAGSSTPVVLPAAQITTLTPPAAIAGFALAANQKNNYSDKQSALQAFTITLASLASSVVGVGRQSTLIDNTTDLYIGAKIYLKLKMGTTPTINTLVYIYLIQYDDSAIADDAAGATDAALTVVNATLLGTILCNAATTGLLYTGIFDTRNIVDSLGPKWGIAIVNATGAALDSTEGSHLKNWIGIKKQLN